MPLIVTKKQTVDNVFKACLTTSYHIYVLEKGKRGGKMSVFNNRIFKISLISVILLLMAWFIRDFNLSIVNVTPEGAEVRVNFIFPVDKETFNSRISLLPDIPNTQFQCDVQWESHHSVVIRLKEKSEIRGQKVRLIITNAQTSIPYIKKNANISVQFQQSPQLIGVSEVSNIPTDAPFIVTFNTPMKRANINKYITSDAHFEIVPVEGTHYSQWLLTPKTPLENNKKYILSFRKGMPAISGLFMEKDQIVTLQTPSKPAVVSVYPKDKARWVEVYPKMIIESGEPIKKALLELDGEILEGKIIGKNRAEFILTKVLDFEKTYYPVAQVVSQHGEKSQPLEFEFTTMPIEEERIWVEIILAKEQKMVVYKGKNPIRTMPCSGGTPEDPTILGTYYLKDRGTQFFAKKIMEGAANWIRIDGNYLIHGLPRDENWVIRKSEEAKIGSAASHGCVRLREVDAQWMYDNIPQNTMVIIHH